MTTYRLISTKGTREVNGSREDAIAAAVAMEAELQPSFGVTVEDADGQTVAVIPDGVYFVWSAGSAWTAAKFCGGRMVAWTEESNAETHAAANDSWAGVVPSETDEEVDSDEAKAVIRAVLGDVADWESISVTMAD